MPLFQAIGPEGFGTYEVDLSGSAPQFHPKAGKVDRLLLPGFVDIHIHGAFGIDFMSATTTELVGLCEKLRERGYEGFVPTTVTSPADAVLGAVAKLPDHRMILGFHLEGPFISPVYPGAQPPSFIAAPPVGASEWDEVFNHPQLKVATIAPEIPQALDLISFLATRSVRVGIGHTNATYAEAKAGFEAGATHATHTFNAMRALHHREAGTVGFALQEDQLACELIYDRHHVSREAAALLFKCKPTNKVVAISDATMAAGLPAGAQLDMWGLDAVVGEGDVRLKSGTLAGSAATLDVVFHNLLADFGAETAIRACCLNPRLLLGLPDEPCTWLETDMSGNILERHSA